MVKKRPVANSNLLQPDWNRRKGQRLHEIGATPPQKESLKKAADLDDTINDRDDDQAAQALQD